MSNREKVFSAILIDINNFKYINDTYGHNIGDSALEAAAKLLKSCLRTSDFIARYGGDEFCIIPDISNKNDLEALICGLITALKNITSLNPILTSLSSVWVMQCMTTNHKRVQRISKTG